MKHLRNLFLCFLAILSSLPSRALAQDKQNQLAFSVGGEFIPSNSLASPEAGIGPGVKYGSSFALDLAYARRVHSFRRAALWLELPAVVGPSHTVSNGDPTLPTSLATFFVAPSLRFNLPGTHTFTPWASFGGGYGLFETSSLLRNGTPNQDRLTSTGVLQFGGGVDVRTPLHLLSIPIGLRAEYRDFYTFAAPSYSLPVTGQSEHHQTVGGGITAHF